MSKISQYLNEHILGDISTDSAVRKYLSLDSSILAITPEIVAYPRITNDIRKIARFTYQLAIKGHAISITPRGMGTDRTGAAIGPGIIVNTTAHMNRIFEFDSKQRLVRVQPGATLRSVNDALQLQGCYIPSFPENIMHSTVGGAVANNATGSLSGKYGAIEEYVEELEVVLANGDVLQTSRLNKRDLGKKKGLQTFEGDIYRAVDNLISDNEKLIAETLGDGNMDNSGYANIAKVKQKNGSFDLTPLFIGSQGTLGVISEMILRADFYNNEESALVAVVSDTQSLHDSIDDLRKLDPDYLDVYSGELIARTRLQGKRYAVCEEAAKRGAVAGLIICGFKDFNERARKKKLKKAEKNIEKFNATTFVAQDKDAMQEVKSLKGLLYASRQPLDRSDSSVISLLSGVYIPDDRFEDFSNSIAKLSKEHGVKLPMSGYALDGVYSYWPEYSLRTVAGKQRLLKLYDEFAKLVDSHNGTLVAESGEGRVKAPFANKYADKDLLKVYEEIKNVFDPEGTLNTGVKQQIDLREVVSHLHTGQDAARLAEYTAE